MSLQGRLEVLAAGTFFAVSAGALCLAVVSYLTSPVDPVSWTPSLPLALEGALAPNEVLRTATIPDEASSIPGPEDVERDDDTRVWASSSEGTIVRFRVGDGAVSIAATTGGRPLGLDWDPLRRRMWVADARRGLLSVEADGSVTERATAPSDGGASFGFTDDVEAALDGTAYFTDASSRFGDADYMLDLMEGRPHGRLLRHSPANGRTDVLLSDLYFANGVALSKAEDFALVNETWRYRVRRYWLSGPKAGTDEVFLDGLPGFPDGITDSGRGTFWIAIAALRKPIAEWLAPRPRARRLLAGLPRMFWPGPDPYGLVIEVGEDGTLLRSFHDPGGQHVSEITSAEERPDKDGRALWLGTLKEARLARLDVGAAPGALPVQKRMAVTVDGLPGRFWAGKDPVLATGEIVEALRSHDVRATAFVACDDVAEPEQQAAIDAWVDAGMDLGVHPASYADLNDTPQAQWLDDVRRCQAWLAGALARKGQPAPRYFRYPGLHEGADVAARDAVRAAIVGMGLRPVPVTIDHHDRLLADAYDRAAAPAPPAPRKPPPPVDAARVSAVEQAHDAHMADAVRFWRSEALRKIGRDIDQVLVLQATGLLAVRLGADLDRLAADGWTFIALEDALSDRVYSLPDEYADKAGLAWLHHLAPAPSEDAWKYRARRDILAKFGEEGG